MTRSGRTRAEHTIHTLFSRNRGPRMKSLARSQAALAAMASLAFVFAGCGSSGNGPSDGGGGSSGAGGSAGHGGSGGPDSPSGGSSGGTKFPSGTICNKSGTKLTPPATIDHVIVFMFENENLG